MTKLLWLMIITTLISMDSSIAQRTSDDNSYEEGYLRSSNNNYNRAKRTSLFKRIEITTTKTSLDKSHQKTDQLSNIQNIFTRIFPTPKLTIHVSNKEHLTNNKDITSSSSTKLPKTKTSSSIVFPDSKDGEHFGISTNRLLPDPRIIEKCSKNRTFCDKVDNYPKQELLNIFRTSQFMSKDYFGVDTDNDFEYRMNSDLQDLCESQEEVIFPEASVNRGDVWHFIIQDKKDSNKAFLQGFKVEICVNPETPCTFNENLPLGYSSICVQQYMYKKMVAVSHTEEIVYEDFKIPSSCKCMYKVNANIFTRKSIRDMKCCECSQNLSESTHEVFNTNTKNNNN